MCWKVETHLIKVSVPKIKTKILKIAAGLTSESAILANVLKMYSASKFWTELDSSGLIPLEKVSCINFDLPKYGSGERWQNKMVDIEWQNTDTDWKQLETGVVVSLCNKTRLLLWPQRCRFQELDISYRDSERATKSKRVIYIFFLISASISTQWISNGPPPVRHSTPIRGRPPIEWRPSIRRRNFSPRPLIEGRCHSIGGRFYLALLSVLSAIA